MTKKSVATTVNPITPQQVEKVAELAHIPVSAKQVSQLTSAFDQTLEVVANLQQVEVAHVSATHQVTGLENIWRKDLVRPEYSFTQAQALANASHTHRGYFVVPQILDQGD